MRPPWEIRGQEGGESAGFEQEGLSNWAAGPANPMSAAHSTRGMRKTGKPRIDAPPGGSTRLDPLRDLEPAFP